MFFKLIIDSMNPNNPDYQIDIDDFKQNWLTKRKQIIVLIESTDGDAMQIVHMCIQPRCKNEK